MSAKACIGLSIAAIVGAVSMPVAAERYWPPATLTEWGMYLNNGVVYIGSPQFATHCAYSRGEIHVDTSYGRALYAYALSAKAKGKALKYVVDSDATNCIIDALQEV